MSGYFNHVANYRGFTIIELIDTRQPDSVMQVHTYHLPPGDTNEITAKLDEVFTNVGWPQNMEIDDRRGWTEAGASGSAQDVIITIGHLVADGVASVVIAELVLWAKGKLGDKIGHSFDYIDHHMKQARSLIIEHFKVQGGLETESVSKKDSGSEVIFKDSRGNKYIVTIEGSGNIEIKKISAPSRKGSQST